MSYVFTTSYNFESTAIDVILFALSDTPEFKKNTISPIFSGEETEAP